MYFNPLDIILYLMSNFHPNRLVTNQISLPRDKVYVLGLASKHILQMRQPTNKMSHLYCIPNSLLFTMIYKF